MDRVANGLLLKLGPVFTGKRKRDPPLSLSAPATLRENERQVQLMVVDSNSSHHPLGVKGFLYSIFFPTWNSLVLWDMSDMGSDDGFKPIGFTGECFMEQGGTES